MDLDIVLIGFALSTGAVAFLNPCGFAMLPTYVSYFVERDYHSSSSSCFHMQTTATTTTVASSTKEETPTPITTTD
jgi:cytochrome c biogenesis protein CcdA